MRRDIERLAASSYDLVVIGGGIYGATITWEATLRGLTVALLEKEDFGHATSANSLKTVHGGLRYLQHADVKRMRESIRERATLLRIAPHLVHPLPCLMPTYGHGFKGREAMQIALLINDTISFDRNRGVSPEKHLPNGRILSKQECLQLLPGIPEDGLNGAAAWYDAQMYNSERLTLAFVQSAAALGAQVANYAPVTGFLHEANRIHGVEVLDHMTGTTHKVQARMVINAAGPWVDRVLGLLPKEQSKLGMKFARAINLATRQLFPTYAVGLKSPRDFKDTDALINTGGRLFFVSPWRNQSLIGTTYTYSEEHPDDLAVTEADIQALLNEFNACYPPAFLTPDDVQFIYKGMVPINGVHTDTGNVQRAKHFQIVDHRREGLTGIITVLGVKYTTARDVAQRVIDQVFENWNEPSPPSRSATTPLHGGEIQQFEQFVNQIVRQSPFGLSEAEIRPLLYNYGTAYESVLSFCNPSEGGRSLSPHHMLVRAEILNAVHHEMAQTLPDVILRRTELGTSGYPGDETVRFCAHIMGQAIGWSDSRMQEEFQEVKRAFQHTNLSIVGEC